MMKFVTVDFHL